jgi:hypothetical protein
MGLYQTRAGPAPMLESTRAIEEFEIFCGLIWKELPNDAKELWQGIGARTGFGIVRVRMVVRGLTT